jgi:hypothetical protein
MCHFNTTKLLNRQVWLTFSPQLSVIVALEPTETALVILSHVSNNYRTFNVLDTFLTLNSGGDYRGRGRGSRGRGGRGGRGGASTDDRHSKTGVS